MAKRNVSLQELTQNVEVLRQQLAEKQALVAMLNNQQKEQDVSTQKAISAKVSRLPAMFGVGTLDDVLSIIRKAQVPVITVDFTGKKGKDIPQAIKEAVVLMSKRKMTGAEIAAACHISLPSVQNIKKAAGLVKSRKAIAA